MLGIEEASELDRGDPIPTGAFDLPEGVVYLDGNSLGAMPGHVLGVAHDVVESQWGTGLIRSWNEADWVSLPGRVGDRIGRIIGAPPGTTIACDSTSVNLFKAASAAIELATGPPVLLTDVSNFPSDRYVLGALASARGWDVVEVEPDGIVKAIDRGVGVVSLTQVDYSTGRKLDIANVTERAHDAGAITVWDLAHSAGAFRVDIDEAGADFAVGCGYKFLNGGPGAPAFLFAAERHHGVMSNPIAGWFSHDRPFDFEPSFEPAVGIGRMQTGTPHVVSMALLEAALDVFDEVDLDLLWSRGQRLVDQLHAGFEQMGLSVLTPSDRGRRGSQVSFRHPQAYAIVQALIDRGVIGDFRTPDIARFGIAPLYLSYRDIANALIELRAVLEQGDLDRFSGRRGQVV